MGVGFGATVAIVLWQHRAGNDPAPHRSAAPVAWHEMTASAGSTRSAGKQAVGAARSDGPAEGGARAGDVPTLPVQLFFYRRMVHDDPAQPRKQSFVIDARIVNATSEPLPVEVRISSPLQSDQSLMIDLAPSALREFGFDDGLVMHPNDMITLRNPRFSDLTMRIVK